MNIELKADKEKQLLYGPFLIPNMLIYRFDETNGEYYVRFQKDEIEKIAEKFNRDTNHNNTNFMHTSEKVDGFVYQNWIIEGENDKSKNLGFDLPEGTWFGAVKIADQNFWNEKVKTNEVRGFSVEILADLQLSLKNKNKIMEKQIDLGSAMLGDGTTPIFFDGETIEVGTAIFTDEAMTMAAADDRWVLEDGRIIVVVGGIVESIEERPIEPIEEEEDLQVEADAPQALTSEEVSMMIDARFQELMDEITALKTGMEKKDDELNSFRAQVSEKFSSIPATASIKQKEEVKIDSKFSAIEARIKEFAKSK
jgi:hypothetical protein